MLPRGVMGWGCVGVGGVDMTMVRRSERSGRSLSSTAATWGAPGKHSGAPGKKKRRITLWGGRVSRAVNPFSLPPGRRDLTDEQLPGQGVIGTICPRSGALVSFLFSPARQKAAQRIRHVALGGWPRQRNFHDGVQCFHTCRTGGPCFSPAMADAGQGVGALAAHAVRARRGVAFGRVQVEQGSQAPSRRKHIIDG